jgi:hypothetical protein
MRDNAQKYCATANFMQAAFMRHLANFWPQFDDRVLKRRVLPALIKVRASKLADMVGATSQVWMENGLTTVCASAQGECVEASWHGGCYFSGMGGKRFDERVLKRSGQALPTLIYIINNKRMWKLAQIMVGALAVTEDEYDARVLKRSG